MKNNARQKNLEHEKGSIHLGVIAILMGIFAVGGWAVSSLLKANFDIPKEHFVRVFSSSFLGAYIVPFTSLMAGGFAVETYEELKAKLAVKKSLKSMSKQQIIELGEIINEIRSVIYGNNTEELGAYSKAQEKNLIDLAHNLTNGLQPNKEQIKQIIALAKDSHYPVGKESLEERQGQSDKIAKRISEKIGIDDYLQNSPKKFAAYIAVTVATFSSICGGVYLFCNKVYGKKPEVQKPVPAQTSHVETLSAPVTSNIVYRNDWAVKTAFKEPEAQASAKQRL